MGFLERLFKKQQSVSQSISQAPADDKGVIERCISVLAHKDAVFENWEDKRRQAAWDLVPFGETAVQRIAELFQSSETMIRQNAAKALGQFGHVSSVAELLANVAENDASKVVRLEAAKALRQMNDPRGNQIFVKLLADKDVYVRGEASFQLAMRGGKWINYEEARSMVPSIITALSDQKIFRNDMQMLDSLNPDWTSLNEARLLLPSLMKTLLQEEGNERAKTIHILQKINPQWTKSAEALKMMPELFDLLKDPDKKKRAATAELLGRIADQAMVTPLIEALKDADWQVRYNAAEALGSMNNSDSIDALCVTMKDDPSAGVRGVATEAIRKLDPERLQQLQNVIAAEQQRAQQQKQPAPSGQYLGCFFASGNESIVASFYKVLRVQFADAPSARYRIRNAVLLSKADTDLPAMNYFGESVLGMESTTISSLKEALRTLAHSAQDVVEIAYISVDSERLLKLGVVYNKVLGEAVKQGILPFRMIVTAFKDAADVIFDCCELVEGGPSSENTEVFVPVPGYKGFCQMCGKPNIDFNVWANRAIFLCSKDCENRYGTLRAESLRLSQVNVTIDTTGTGIADRVQTTRQQAYDSNSYCWFCGKSKKMGDNLCFSCKREADVPFSPA